MTNQEFAHWLEDLPRQIRQYSIVFLQCGHASSETLALLRSTPRLHFRAADFLDSQLSRSESSSTENVVFLHDLESLRKRRGELLSPLRERIMRQSARGSSFALVSSVPKTAYPDTRGSDVVADARQIFLPTLFPSICSDAEMPTDMKSKFMIRSVRDLGDRTVAALSRAFWESQLDPRSALESLARPDVEALRGAGFVRADDSSVSWVATGRDYKNFRMAVGLVCSESNSPNGWVADAYSEIWTLERTLRNIIRAELAVKMGGGWRETCLPESVRAQVLERAHKDSHPSAKKLGDLRDPLEWLSTSELLDLREGHELGGLGLEPHLWVRLRNEIVPIRNKIAHMRLVSELDAQCAAMWRKLVTSKVGLV